MPARRQCKGAKGANELKMAAKLARESSGECVRAGEGSGPELPLTTRTAHGCMHGLIMS